MESEALRPSLVRASLDGVLRSEGVHAPGAQRVQGLSLAIALVVGGVVYGLAMGSYGLAPLQAAYSAAKTPLLLALTSLVCLPNFFVLNAVLGLRDDLAAALRGIFAAQATVALALASLAPLVLFAYVSGVSYPGAKLVNGGAFLLASLAGQLTLRRHYGPLIRRNARHGVALAVWLVLYQAVAIQLAWSLRPFIGSPDQATTFFREESWTNAYVEVLRAVGQVLGGG